MKLEYRTKDRAIINELEGLAYWIANDNYICERYGTEEPERERVKNTLHLIFDNLDKMKVPYWVQNSVITFAENWRQYKTNYLYSYLKSKNIYLGVYAK